MVGQQRQVNTLLHFFSAYPVWSDDDGGWHEGAAYWSGCRQDRLVDGQGQRSHSALSTGSILDFGLSPAMDYIVGSAAAGYEGRLERYRRYVAFVKPDLIVICDDLSATNEATFQFLLHALNPFAVDAATGRATIEQPNAGAAVQYLSPVPLSFRQWDG